MNNRDSTSETTAETLSPREWENICNHCGLCCFEKVRDHRGLVISTPIPCRHLNLQNHECKVYDKRFTVGEDCQQLTPEVVATVDWLPAECAYRQQLSPFPPVKKRTADFHKKKAIRHKKSPYYQDDMES